MAATDQTAGIDVEWPDDVDDLYQLRSDRTCELRPILLQLTGDTLHVLPGRHEAAGTPGDVWHGRTLEWSVPPVHPHDLRSVIDDHRDLLDRIAEGHTVEWDGSNNVGRLTDDAMEAKDELEHQLLRDLPTDVGLDYVPVWTAYDWLTAHGQDCEAALDWVEAVTGLRITEDTSDEDLEGIADQVREEIEFKHTDEVYVLTDVLSGLETLRDDVYYYDLRAEDPA